jgi:hypothetical protein
VNGAVTGITSSQARDDANMFICLGIVTGEEFLDVLGLEFFLGQEITDHEGWLLIRPTVLGDSDLSGEATGDDYGYIDYAFQSHNTPSTWMWGDYDCDGNIDSDDYGFIDYAFGAHAQYSA